MSEEATKTPDEGTREATKTPDEWAQAMFPLPSERWKHAVAEQLHGWREHAHEAGAPMQLTAAAYQGAIDASLVSGKDAGPHAAALSVHSPLAKRAAKEVAARERASNAPRPMSSPPAPFSSKKDSK